jgi:2-polyprenyl-6-methoxyphenol hydroxylase-like FAD-dependent oxidoreductase
MQTHYDAIIIGAGPAGATAAILLAQAGWAVALVEKQRFPRRKVCGECIAAPNLSLLAALGLGSAFEALAGPPLRQIVLMYRDQSLCADLPPAAQAPHWGQALGREYFDTLLLDRAQQAGASILQPWAVHAIHGRPGAFECDAESADADAAVTLAAPVLIAAYGSWERAPSANAAQRPQRADDLLAFKANFRKADLADGMLPVLAFPGGYGGMVVGNHGITTLACCIRRDRLRACRQQRAGERAGDVVESYLQAHCLGVQKALAGAQRDGQWLSAGPIRPGIRLARDGGDIFLVGNAAGEAHPIIGEGISMAMQSAWLLCRQLVSHGKTLRGGGAQQWIQREYADAWRRNFRRRIHLAALFAHLAMRPALASGLLPLLRCWPAAFTHAARWSGKVKQAAAALPETAAF